MRISPSIASADIMRVEEEVQFVNRYFDDIHLDVADGVAVNEITFGLKMCSRIRKIAKCPISLHLEVSNPLKYLKQIKECSYDMVFIQIDCLEEPQKVIRIFEENQIPTGINISNLDLQREGLEEILGLAEHVLVNTTYHNDPGQLLQIEMLNYAIDLAENTAHKVWIDGAINWDIVNRIRNTSIDTIVMGRAIFSDKEQAVKNRESLYMQ